MVAAAVSHSNHQETTVVATADQAPNTAESWCGLNSTPNTIYMQESSGREAE